MTFKDQLKDHALNVILNTNEFAESISYTPKGGAAKTIKAIVNRQRANPASEISNRGLVNQAEIIIFKDATNGVASVIEDADTAVIADYPGGPTQTYRVKNILSSDEGMWHLLLQR